MAFEDHFTKTDGCWNWTGRTAKKYGKYRVSRNGKRMEVGAHRIAWQRSHNRKVPKNKHVLHRCDNPLCVNPDHLFLGTNKMNVLDMMRKKRQGKKLKAQEVIKIRELAKEGKTVSEIAKRYGVTLSNIRYIISGKTWKNIPY